MSNELLRYGQNALVKSEGTLAQESGKALTSIGVGGLVLWALSGVIPFVGLPAMLVLAVLLGVFLRLR